MDIYSFLTLIGGLSLFLFGMNIMGQALEKRAGNSLKSILEKITSSPIAGLLTGMAVTAVIQSSSATTVMVVGFVNSGLMNLRQAINVIMGANIGTTVTAWILSLGGISSDNPFVQLLKPTSFTPILALIGVIFYMFLSDSRKKDTGLILLGFATLMFGMETMSTAVSGLKDVPEFRNILLMFQNPLLGVLAGAILTAIIQSSSASVGILQALASTGQITYGASVPIIMGQNIGTCITAMLSSIGTNKNAKRAAVVHLSFNVIGTVFWLAVFWIYKEIVSPAILQDSTSLAGIAVIHTSFNILCTLLLLPMAKLLDRLAHIIIPDAKGKEEESILDERLLSTPPIALEISRTTTANMAKDSISAIKDAMLCVKKFDNSLADSIRKREARTDKLEDELGTYLVKLSSLQISTDDSAEAAELLKLIGDYERIGDHAVNILEAAEEKYRKGIDFTDGAMHELAMLENAVSEILDITFDAFVNKSVETALKVEPLEQVIDTLKEQLRSRHIYRLQNGECTIDAGFIWSDLLTSLERTSDHCSNIAWGIIGIGSHDKEDYESMHHNKIDNEEYKSMFAYYSKKYQIEPL